MRNSAKAWIEDPDQPVYNCDGNYRGNRSYIIKSYDPEHCRDLKKFSKFVKKELRDRFAKTEDARKCWYIHHLWRHYWDECAYSSYEDSDSEDENGCRQCRSSDTGMCKRCYRLEFGY